MPAIITRPACISLGGNAEWKVHARNIRTIGGSEFLKISPWDASFARLVCDGVVEQLPKNPTLCQSAGFKELAELRNNKQAEDLQASSEPSPPKCALFADAPAAPAKRPRRWSSKELKEASELLSVEVPGAGERPSMIVQFVRPTHAREDLVVPLDSAVIEHIVLFIRDNGVSSDSVSSKRDYKKEAMPQGIWRRGEGFVVKVPSDSDGRSYRLKRAKTKDAALALVNGPEPLQDQEASSEETLAAAGGPLALGPPPSPDSAAEAASEEGREVEGGLFGPHLRSAWSSNV